MVHNALHGMMLSSGAARLLHKRHAFPVQHMPDCHMASPCIPAAAADICQMSPVDTSSRREGGGIERAQQHYDCAFLSPGLDV